MRALAFILALIAALALPFAAPPPVEAQYMQQSGVVTPAHPGCWVTTGIMQDCGSATAPVISSLGVLNNGGYGFCIQSALAPAPFQAMCWGVGTNGVGFWSLQPNGGATPQTLQIQLNGYKYSPEYVLSQTGIAFLEIGQVTFTGTTGAFTLGVTLPLAFPAAYVYVPVGGFDTVNPLVAGWYYTVFSTASAGQMYTTLYVSGTPTIPVSPVDVTTTAQTYSAPNGTTISGPGVPVIPIPPMAINDSFTWSLYVGGDTTTATKSVIYNWAGVTLRSQTQTTAPYQFGSLYVSNEGSQNLQIYQTAPPSFSGSATSLSTNGGTSSINTALSTVLSESMGISSHAGTSTCALCWAGLFRYALEYLPGL